MNTQSPLALVVEDEPQIRRFVCSALRDESCRASEAGSAAQGLDLAAREQPDLVVLDLGLPDRDGVDFIRELRVWSAVPVLVLSARTDESDKIAALDAGADDYLTKPFSPRELVARVRAMLRRPRSSPETSGAQQTLHFGPLTIDHARHEVLLEDVPLGLTNLEYDLLTAMASAPGRTFTRAQLLDRVWGADYFGDDHVVDVHIANLRKKLGEDSAQPHFIITVRGVGYRFGDRR